MLVKKLGTIAATGALLLAVAAPAFADVSVNNHGFVTVESVTGADSGSNLVSGTDEGQVEDVNVTTGAAVASSTVGTELNNNTVTVNNNEDGMPDVDVNNCGMVMVEVATGANSGNNVVAANEDEGSVEGANVTTGAATAASNVQSLVNVNSVTVNGNEGFDL